jgi:osmotically-inducible protein OsmY
MITARNTSDNIRFAGDLDSRQDDLLCLKVTRGLQSSGYGLLQRLMCEVNNGVVTLSGAVPSFFLKQMAQEVVLGLEHARQVNNLVEVLGGEFVRALDSNADLCQMVESIGR